MGKRYSRDHIFNGLIYQKLSLEEDKSLKATPIIAVTANALSEDRERFINAGMDEYVSKPYSEKDIVNVLQKILG